MSKNGGATEDTLPALPPVYVIAALQDDLRAIKKAARKGTANKLITTYLWRAFLTDRYEAQANDRLFEDFKGLQRCLEQIKDKGNYADPPVIFNDTEHSLPTAEELTKPLQWIRRKRLGRAVAAIAMRRMPRDWVTGETLDANTIRTLEDTSNLDRHHVFPREVLKVHCTTEEINHGLNGVPAHERIKSRALEKGPGPVTTMDSQGDKRSERDRASWQGRVAPRSVRCPQIRRHDEKSIQELPEEKSPTRSSGDCNRRWVVHLKDSRSVTGNDQGKREKASAQS